MRAIWELIVTHNEEIKSKLIINNNIINDRLVRNIPDTTGLLESPEPDNNSIMLNDMLVQSSSKYNLTYVGNDDQSHLQSIKCNLETSLFDNENEPGGADHSSDPRSMAGAGTNANNRPLIEQLSPEDTSLFLPKISESSRTSALGASALLGYVI